jgi:hypothetical protein
MYTLTHKQNQAHERTSSNLTKLDTAASAHSHHANPLQLLQRTVGNQVVLRLLREDTSSAVSSSSIDRTCATCESGKRSCPNCAKEEERVPRILAMVNVIQRQKAKEEETRPKKKEEAAPKKKEETPPKKEKKAKCPTQTVTMSREQCGADYGAVGKYCYNGATGWWFKEKVVMGSPNTCVPGAKIDMTSTPFQAKGNCVADEIINQNGPPSGVAPCKIATKQTVFTGPTEAAVEQCKYENTQVIEVTVTKGSKPKSGKVITTSAGVSTSCDWP